VRPLFFLIAVAACATALAQQNTFASKLLTTPPTIDGNVTDQEWGDVPSASGGFDEQTGAPDPYGSQYWLAYDKDYIYIAARFADPNPSQISGTEFRQNVSLNGNDRVIFAVDPFSTLSDTNQFEISPKGGTNVRISGGRAAKREWVGEFLAKARITDKGWEIEARIPWSIMRLPAPGVRDLRVTFGRVFQRTGRAYILDNIAGGKSSNIGIWKQVDVPRPAVKRSIKLLPYSYAGADRDGVIANGGLDFKAPITSDLDLVGSINPDFRNIENQVLSIDFSYFERLAGESRPFFLEGADYFSTSRDAPLFASQRIEGFDFGMKTYGKLGENSTLAMLNTVDFNNENDFVGAFRYSFNPHTSARMAVADLESPLKTNRGTFFSFNHEFAPLSFFGQHMATTDSVVGDGHRYNTGFQYNQNGVQSLLEYTEVSPKFLPRLGFAPERDFKGIHGNLEYVRPANWGKVIETGGGFSFSDLRTFEGTKYRRSFGVDATLTTRDGTDLDLFASYEEFQGFKDRYIFFSIERPRGDPYRHWQLDFIGGNIAGHSYRSIRPSLNYRPQKNLQLRASYQRVDHFTRQEQTILSLSYDLSPSDAISGRLLRQGSDTGFYLAFRRTGNKGNEYFLIIGDPQSTTFRASVILKAVFPLELRF
jgi:hypothetical protein